MSDTLVFNAEICTRYRFKCLIYEGLSVLLTEQYSYDFG
ncbi:MAG: hypothetical protein ACI935_001879 [Moritella dasanensis]|jgi:hypothetical protein